MLRALNMFTSNIDNIYYKFMANTDTWQFHNLLTDQKLVFSANLDAMVIQIGQQKVLICLGKVKKLATLLASFPFTNSTKK